METTGPKPDWKDQFKVEHPLERLPQEAREAFGKFLRKRSAKRALYLLYPEVEWDKPIGDGDSPKRELLLSIGNDRLRSKALGEGSWTAWSYEKSNPKEYQLLAGLEKDQLIEKLDKSTIELYDAVRESRYLQQEISLPNGEKASGIGLIWGAWEHDNYHLGMENVYLSLFKMQKNRPQELKDEWG